MTNTSNPASIIDLWYEFKWRNPNEKFEDYYSSFRDDRMNFLIGGILVIASVVCVIYQHYYLCGYLGMYMFVWVLRGEWNKHGIFKKGSVDMFLLLGIAIYTLFAIFELGVFLTIFLLYGLFALRKYLRYRNYNVALFRIFEKNREKFQNLMEVKK